MPDNTRSTISDTPTGSSPESADDLLAAIVNSSNDAIVCKDLNGIITNWNPAAERIFGYSACEIIGHSILLLIPADLHAEEGEILRKIKSGEQIRHYETERVRKGGDRFAISVSISPIKDRTGQITGASKIARDISERKRADLTRFRLAAIVDSADDAIISKDLNGIVESWNEGACRMFGYNSEEMIGQPIRRIIPKDLQHEEEGFLERLRAGQRVEHFETVRVKKNGELIEVSVTISPIRNHQGQVIGASKIARDISDRKRLEKILVQTEKLAATGRMAAAIAHEINNPLEALMNLIFLARTECSENEIAQGYLLTAEGELERVSHIARQTLGYYRDTSAPAELYLHDILENILNVYQSKLVSSAISVESTWNDVDKICVSRGEMLQVFSNVVTNAIDSMPEGGKLSLSVQRAPTPNGDGLETVIEDQGIGISQEDLGKIFEPFFTTKGDLGTGIGLWVTKKLIEYRGGRVEVSSSTKPGSSGTRVTVFLPFALPQQTSESDPFTSFPTPAGKQQASTHPISSESIF